MLCFLQFADLFSNPQAQGRTNWQTTRFPESRQEDEWRCCGEGGNDGPGIVHRDDPRNSAGARGLSAAKPGCRARFLFGHFLFRAGKEKVTRRKGETRNSG